MPKYTIAIIVSAVLALAASPVPTVSEIKSPAPPGSGQPNLTVAADGRVFLSWIEPDTPQGYVLRFSVRGAQGWSAPKTIARGANWFVSDADVPSLAVLSDGTLAADWFVASVGPRSEAYDVNLVLSKDGGTTWSKPLMPHRDGKKRQHGFVSLVPTPDAKLAAIWLDGRNMPSEEEGDMALMYTTIAANGTLGPETQIDNRACECCKTSMTATADGLVAVYRDRSDKEIRDISIVRYANGRWSQPQALTNDGWEIDGCPINGPAVSANGRNVAVAWFTAPDDKSQVYVLMSADSGKTFGKKIRIDDGNPIGRVDVVSRSSGAAVVSWVERTSQGAQVRVREVAANGTAAAPMNVSGTAGLGSGVFPRMVRSGDDIVVAWTDASKPAQIRTVVVR
ncbi:MAG: hypothetical protein DMG17_18855 [Acidobacteria bacterium]|nr:MAG: hypothetical protein DMG17_18855 [Acidobacteriota bacterium]